MAIRITMAVGLAQQAKRALVWLLVTLAAVYSVVLDQFSRDSSDKEVEKQQINLTLNQEQQMTQCFPSIANTPHGYEPCQPTYCRRLSQAACIGCASRLTTRRPDSLTRPGRRPRPGWLKRLPRPFLTAQAGMPAVVVGKRKRAERGRQLPRRINT